MTDKLYKNLNQAGIVSITVTIVFVVVISLTVFGFTQVANRDSRQSLDRQLSSQAYYAAESGAKDAQSHLAQLLATGKPTPTQSTCTGEYTKNAGHINDDDTDIGYTCMLVDPTPEKVVRSNLFSVSWVTPIENESGTPLNEYTVSWERESISTDEASVTNCHQTPNTSGSHPSAEDWTNSKCPFGMLRIDLVPAEAPVLADPAVAAKKTMTIFAYPKSSAGSPPAVEYDTGDPSLNPVFAPNGAPQGRVIAASCNEDTCTLKLTNLGFSKAYLRLKTLYLPSQSVQVGASANESIKGSQAVIDVTGKARDVLRRIEFRVPLTGDVNNGGASNFSDFAVQSGDSICKRYVTSPTVVEDISSGWPSCSD